MRGGGGKYLDKGAAAAEEEDNEWVGENVSTGKRSKNVFIFEVVKFFKASHNCLESQRSCFFLLLTLYYKLKWQV